MFGILQHLQTSHPECFSIPGETEIKQFINKMPESWYAKLNDILEQNLKEKSRVIYNEFINSYDGKFPHDLPTKENGDPVDTKIKQALQRFKRSIESKVQKNVLM